MIPNAIKHSCLDWDNMFFFANSAKFWFNAVRRVVRMLLCTQGFYLDIKMIPSKFNIKYDVDGFFRRTPAATPEPRSQPVTIVSEIIELSSDEEPDDPNRTPDFNDLPIAELEVKKEQLERALNENGDEIDDDNEVGENNDFDLNRANAISEPMCQNEENVQATPMVVHGYRTPESLGHSSVLSNGIGSIVNNYSGGDLSDVSEDDFNLDLPSLNRTVQMPSTQKVQFQVRKSHQNPVKPEKSQNLPRNLIQNDDTTQMVPEAAHQRYSPLYSDQRDEQFSTENSYGAQFATNSDMMDLDFALPTTPTLFAQHSQKPHITPPANYNDNIILNQSYTNNNTDGNRYKYYSPANNVFFESPGATPVYATRERPVEDMIDEKIAKIKEENEQARKEEIDNMMKVVKENLLKELREEVVMVPKNEYELLINQRNADNSHHTTKNGERKRSSLSPKCHPNEHSLERSADKRHKSNHYGDRERHRSSSSSKDNRFHDHHRSTSSSSKTDKSAHKTSTVTSGSYQPFHSDSNSSRMDYENDTSSSSSIDTVFKRPSVEKETKTRTPNEDAQYTIKSTFERSKLYASPSTKAWQNESYRFTQKMHQAFNNGDEPMTPGTVAKNTDKLLYLKSDKAKVCPICVKPYMRMVFHMKSHHVNYEVYVSRVSAKMVAKIRANDGKMPVTKYMRPNSAQYLKALCLFCEEEKDFMPQYWNDHIRSHTGEYGRECDLCLNRVCFHTHCGNPTRVVDKFNPYEENLCVYVCRKCNYTQIDKKKIQTHLRAEHEMNDESEFKKYYRKVTLLPAMKSLPFTNPNGTLSYGPFPSKTQRYVEKSVRPQPAKQKTTSQPSTSRITVLENRVIRSAVDTTSATESEAENMDTNCGEGEMQNDDNHATATNDTTNPMNAYKIDPETEKALLNAYTNVDEKEYKYQVRPWIDEYTKKPAIDLMTQFALYKCMHPMCLYATNDDQNWESHMDKHLDMFDVLTKRNAVIGKATRDQHIKFRDCPYCPHQAKANYQVLDHMAEHRRNAFQCAHCFYRCLEMDNIVMHYEKYHIGKSCDVLLCSEYVEHFEDRDEDQIKFDLANVMKIKCGQNACSKEFACFNSLCEHLKECHPNKDDLYSCPYCVRSVKRTVSAIRTHLLDEHFETDQLGEFQCIYCKNVGFSQIEDIRTHMFENHGSNFLFIAVRLSAKPENDEGEAQLVYIGDSRDGFPLYKCANPEALDYMDAAQLDILTQLEVLKLKQSVAKKEAFTGVLPSIKVNANFSYITLDDYAQLRHRTSQSVQSASHPAVQATEAQRQPSPAKQMPEQEPQNVTPKVKTLSHQSVKSEFHKLKCDPQQLANAEATPSSTSVQPTMTYKCISVEMAKDLESLSNSSYSSLLCKSCSQFIRMDRTTGITPLITHIMEDPVCAKKTKCNETSHIEKTMMQHRIKAHSDKNDEIVYLQEEKTPNTLVYKLVRCKFECLQCNERFNNVPTLKKHHQNNHLDRYLRSAVIHQIKVIQSNDTQQLVTSDHSEIQHYVLNNLFSCKRHSMTLVTRSNALEHHNDSHIKHNFELNINTLLMEDQSTHNDDHKLHVLECEHCSKLFGSTESMHAHIEAIQPNNPETALYTIKRLLVCPEPKCKIISTFSGLDAHYSAKHPGKVCTPMHPINNQLCGLCRSQVAEKDRVQHYKKFHQRGEVVGNVLLRLLKLEDFDLNKCHFTPGCCDENRFERIAQCINYVSTCKHRLCCNDCPESPRFQQVQELAKHRKEVHLENPDEVIHHIHNIKHFMRLLGGMKIFFPTGFVVTKNAIDDTKLGGKFRDEIVTCIEEFFAREKI
ncbi:uncharacterized protein LOC129574228 isoform X2 [Sitodiplosis mosellana]|uniref:uncharacterized protein LOC129574228 isoform X2 n=1 Tax=Sitodiplosis mosellana TaxID=263140 RepID=UPI002444CA5A|nr:uncharacterized protein LOC129574228 isoform X2 [Sitodiplosis mosellana]